MEVQVSMIFWIHDVELDERAILKPSTDQCLMEIFALESLNVSMLLTILPPTYSQSSATLVLVNICLNAASPSVRLNHFINSSFIDNMSHIIWNNS